MDVRIWSIFLFVIIPAGICFRKSSEEDRRPDYRRGIHYHTKRHMALTSNELKRRPTTLKPREKPSGHLKALNEDDIENDEVVSVAVGPPPLRLNYDKMQRKQTQVSARPNNNTTPNVSATNLVKDVLVELGREFLTRQINEDFIFGQYVGNAMKNLTTELRLRMQHEILDMILKYQKDSTDNIKMEHIKSEKQLAPPLKELKSHRRVTGNDTDENWPDFTNLEKIVG